MISDPILTDAELDAIEQREIVVCARCERASCWQSQFALCGEWAIGPKRISVAELRRKGLEDPRFWDRDIPRLIATIRALRKERER